MTVGGDPMRWLESGAGPTVVLIHGIPTSPDLWRQVLPPLDSVRSLAWEMVGDGRSSEWTSPSRQAGYLGG
jgi:pimeloyl-ACP methyl ester carboxylesterase